MFLDIEINRILLDFLLCIYSSLEQQRQFSNKNLCK